MLIAQLHWILLESSTAIDGGELQQFQISSKIGESCFQKCPIMLVDQGLIKNNARFMEKFDEKVREPNEENDANGSRSEQNEVLIQFLL